MPGNRKAKQPVFDSSFAFYAQLWEFYCHNRRKIRSRYNDLTKKFLVYNDRTENPTAFLRTPQFEALEMYVFIKEFTDNAQVCDLFQEWKERKGHFDKEAYYAVDTLGQLSLFETLSEEMLNSIFSQMTEYKEEYPNYIYALTMGLGKTILMATCIFYEFLLANKYPKDKRFCHNALVFAPDKTVLQSLLEIKTFDKSKVVPREYVHLLDTNIHFHYMDDATTLQTLDFSDFNIVISNTQKIIVKQRRTELSTAEKLFKTTPSLLADLYDDSGKEVVDESGLIENQRFKKLCKLPQLGVYVDEAHHLFGSDLQKQMHEKRKKKKTQNEDNAKKQADESTTSLRNTINMLAKKTQLVACYNYTGTPYVEKNLLPEVVYAYGLAESIRHNYLKEAEPIGYENVRDEAFIRTVIREFWKRYGKEKYEGLTPKIAIYASTVADAVDVVRPVVEKTIAELGLSTEAVLVNVGDPKYTKDEDIRNFNDLDVAGSTGNQKQFIILVEKGKEGWNCRSLFAVALFREPNSKIFILQATMRCLRAITIQQQKATVFLSKKNYDILDSELNNNFNVSLSDLGNKPAPNKKRYHVTVLPPPRVLKVKCVFHRHILEKIPYDKPVSFGLAEMNLEKYKSRIYSKASLSSQGGSHVQEANHLQENRQFTAYMLTAEIAIYLHLPCVLVHKVLSEATDGMETILEKVNQFNDILYDVVIPRIFNAFYRIKTERVTEEREITLLKNPPHSHAFYEYSADEELVVTTQNPPWAHAHVLKSFHADTYCFDSKPEYECFRQYLLSTKVRKVYFTGMFTSLSQSELSIPYVDPESKCLRHYYPDFLAEMSDGSYQLIEVKGDNMIDDAVVQAKSKAAEEFADASSMQYKMIRGTAVLNSNILA